MLEDYGLLTEVQPSGDGWWFEQELNGRKYRLPPTGSAKTAKELCEMVREFRIINNLVLDGYEREIANHIKSVSPQNDQWKGVKNSDDLVKPEKIDRNPLIIRITKWLIEASCHEPKLVGKEEIKRRAEICKECPRNVRWQNDCQPCVRAVHNRGRALRGVVFIPEADILLACQLHDLYLPAAVCLDIDNLPHKKPNAPAPCWLKSHGHQGQTNSECDKADSNHGGGAE
jgi:hypothetical protein